MALKVPVRYEGYCIYHSGQHRTATFTLRSSSMVLGTWDRNITVIEKGGPLLFTKGEEIIWINNGTRKIEVQMSVVDPDYGPSNPVAVFDPVTIKVNECYVLETPTNLRDITGNSRGRRNSGSKT